MHIHIGSANKIIRIIDDINKDCDECGSYSLNYVIWQKYLHVYGIPIFPLIKFCGLYCTNCYKSTILVYNKDSSDYIKRTKTPIYMYLLPIFILFIFLMIIGNWIIK
jgi:hypothetical protein